MFKTVAKEFCRLALWGNFIISHFSNEKVFREVHAQFHMPTVKASKNFKAMVKVKILDINPKAL